MALSDYTNKDTPAWQIIEYLQRSGSGTIKELEDVLGITTTAVRQHLGSLQSDGYVERRRVSTGVGRPHYAYFVTARVQEIFACHCDDLALTLLEEVFELEGFGKTQILLDRVSERLANKYNEEIRSVALQARVQEFADVLNERGVLTELDDSNNEILLKTYNCPFHDLAQEHNEICEMDKAMVERVLGTDVNLSSRITDGDRCCSFTVSSDS